MLDAVDDGAVVSQAEFMADALVGTSQQVSAEHHEHLTHEDGFGVSIPAFEFCHGEPVELRDGSQDFDHPRISIAQVECLREFHVHTSGNRTNSCFTSSENTLASRSLSRFLNHLE